DVESTVSPNRLGGRPAQSIQGPESLRWAPSADSIDPLDTLSINSRTERMNGRRIGVWTARPGDGLNERRIGDWTTAVQYICDAGQTPVRRCEGRFDLLACHRPAARRSRGAAASRLHQ